MRRKRKLNATQITRRLWSLALIMAILLIAAVLASCTQMRINTAARVGRVQLLALTEYVKTANQSITRDTALTDEDRAAWLADGEKLIRNQADMQQLIEGQQ